MLAGAVYNRVLRCLQVWVTIAALLNYEVVRLNTVRD